MISAEEAKQLVTNSVERKTKLQLELVEEKIIEAAENGQLYCQIDEYLLPQVEKHLKELNYQVKSNWARNESWTTIRWGEPVC